MHKEIFRKMKKIFEFVLVLGLLAASTTVVKAQTPPAGGYPLAGYETYLPGPGNTYYLDAVNGNDITGDGSSGSPWQTLARAQNMVTSGDNVILRSGNYGPFAENDANGRTTWVTYRAEEGSNPVFTSISLLYPTLQDSYLRFDGIEVYFYGSGSTGINITNARYLEIRHGKTVGDNKFLTLAGIDLDTCEAILIYHTEITNSHRGLDFSDSRALTVSNNYIHEIGAGSGIRVLDGNEDVVIERNHVHDSNEDPTHPDNPADPHSSAISVRSGDLVIRQNILHDIGSSSGIMFYERDAAGGEDVYENILLENNVMYDIENRNVLRLDYLGDNIVVRNNTIIGRYRDINTGTYRLCTALATNLANGYDGTGLSVYNNIFAGAVWLPGPANTANNIYWSLALLDDPFNFLCTPTGSGSKILTCNADFPEQYWFDNFFVQSPIFTPDHRQTLDFRPHYLSEAINFGDPGHQPTDSLGTLDANGFIQNNGCTRDANHHTAGAYEYSSVFLPVVLK
jgi:hypothetical protein